MREFGKRKKEREGGREGGGRERERERQETDQQGEGGQKTPRKGETDCKRHLQAIGEQNQKERKRVLDACRKKDAQMSFVFCIHVCLI
jgi:hypothetical protein